MSTANGSPSSALDIYCIAIGGTGMAPLACLLKEEGHQVRGSDLPLYPPMSTLLEQAGIVPNQGYHPSHLEPAPDLVVVGNAVPRDNPEARAVEERGLPRISMPQALARFFLAGRSPLVVAGAHGKTTTTSMAAWVYSVCGADPGYLIGGWPQDLPTSFRRGGGKRFMVEGDEYNAAYFDRGPKFLHYQPETLILTSVEYDHADLYPDPQALLDAYRSLLELVPAQGLVIACGDSPDVRQATRGVEARVLFYGLGSENEVSPAGPVEVTSSGTHFAIEDPVAGRVEVHLSVWGEHNASNALAVWAAARRDGLPPQQVADALGRFKGVRRRLEELGRCGDVVVIDDFAHHPSEIGQSLAALRHRFPRRRLVAGFEPRSLTAGQSFLFPAYEKAFATADRVHLAPIFHAGRLEDEKRLDLAQLAAALSRDGVATDCHHDVDALLDAVVAQTQAGDVVVTMSSGSFAGLPRRLLEALAESGSA